MIRPTVKPTSTQTPRRVPPPGTRCSCQVHRVTRSGSGRSTHGTEQTSRPRPAPSYAFVLAVGWLLTNHPLWPMQLAGAACDSPLRVDELLGLGLADSARQIVIDREWSISVPEGPVGSRGGKEIAGHREHARAEHAQRDRRSQSLRPCCRHDPAGRMVALPGRKVGHRTVVFSGERFAAGEPLLVDSHACPVRPDTPHGLVWKSMSREATSAEKDER